MVASLNHVVNDFANQLFLKKAVINGKIIGFVRVYKKGESIFIGRLMVYPELIWRAGTKLINEIETIFEDQNIERFCRS